MPIDFPNAPTTGSTFTSGNRTWQYDGAKWVPASTSPSGFVLEASTDGQSYERQNSVWVPSVGFAQGFTNRLRNGGFDVWQRGAGGFSCPAGTVTYTADGWIVTPTGAAVTASQNANGLTNATRYALTVTGAAGVTGELIQQRLESFVSAPLDGKTVTFQVKIYQNSGATITPQLSMLYPNAADNWPGGYSTVLSAVNLQPCPNNAVTQVAYTFAMPAATAVNGLAVNIGFGTHGAWAFVLGEADLRATPGLPVGLQANPPPPELRPIHEELAFCQRYYDVQTHSMLIGAYAAGILFGYTFPFHAQMRTVPTMILSNTTYSNSSGMTAQSQGMNVMLYATATAIGGAQWTTTINASAEL